MQNLEKLSQNQISEIIHTLHQLKNDIEDWINTPEYNNPKIKEQSQAEDIEIIEKTFERLKKLLY
jgi:TusA-related sulfurtransferase